MTNTCYKCHFIQEASPLIICKNCGSIQPAELLNPFDIFGLPTKFDIDLQQLDTAYYKLQQQVHPDSLSHNNKHLENWSSAVNAGYKTLKSKLERIELLLNLAGSSTEAVTPPPELLLQAMQWREELANCENINSIHSLQKQTIQQQQQKYQQVSKLLAKGLYNEAALIYTYLKFISRFLQEIEAAIESRE